MTIPCRVRIATQLIIPSPSARDDHVWSLPLRPDAPLPAVALSFVAAEVLTAMGGDPVFEVDQCAREIERGAGQVVVEEVHVPQLQPVEVRLRRRLFLPRCGEEAVHEADGAQDRGDVVGMVAHACSLEEIRERANPLPAREK